MNIKEKLLNSKLVEKVAKSEAVATFLWGLIESRNWQAVFDQESIEKTSQHLNDGSLLVVFNHLSLPDPEYVILFLREHFGESINRLVLPMSMKFSDGRMGPSKQMIENISSKQNLGVYPMIQHYDEKYSDLARAKKFIDVSNNIIEVLFQDGGTSIIAPEGTRSGDGSLQEGQRGIEFIFEKAPALKERTLILPIGLYGTEKLIKPGSFKVNLWAKIKLNVGFPLTYNDISEFSQRRSVNFTDGMMYKIGQLLPEEYWGHYAGGLRREI